MTDDREQSPQARRPLTRREAECIRLAALGRTTVESAAELQVTERTIEFHMANALRKLGAPNRIRAVVVAVQEGLIEL